MTFCNPTGVLIPEYVGQMFFDHVSHIFYQARGQTENDWHFVAPDEMVGSFVKLYDYYLGTPDTDPRGEAAEEWTKDSEISAGMMRMEGLLPMRLMRWRTFGNIDVMMARVRFDKVDGMSHFIGFCERPVTYRMPSGAGFNIISGLIWFGDVIVGRAPIENPVMFRVEIGGHTAAGFINNAPVGTIEVPRVTFTPVIALFNHNGGRREVFPGYDGLLQKRQKKCEQ